jgi:hypothetical protein
MFLNVVAPMRNNINLRAKRITTPLLRTKFVTSVKNYKNIGKKFSDSWHTLQLYALPASELLARHMATCGKNGKLDLVSEFKLNFVLRTSPTKAIEATQPARDKANSQQSFNAPTTIELAAQCPKKRRKKKPSPA